MHKERNSHICAKIWNTQGLLTPQMHGPMMENGNITVGSYCYCDCDTYFVVVTEVLDENKYRIIDLFEQRARISYTSSLRLITDSETLKDAQEQHKEYLMNPQDPNTEREDA